MDILSHFSLRGIIVTNYDICLLWCFKSNKKKHLNSKQNSSDPGHNTNNPLVG